MRRLADVFGVIESLKADELIVELIDEWRAKWASR